MCVKKKTIVYEARASNSKRECEVVALPISTCERLNMMTSVHEERLRAWSLLLLAATVRSFAYKRSGFPIATGPRFYLHCYRAIVELLLLQLNKDFVDIKICAPGNLRKKF